MCAYCYLCVKLKMSKYICCSSRHFYTQNPKLERINFNHHFIKMCWQSSNDQPPLPKHARAASPTQRTHTPVRADAAASFRRHISRLFGNCFCERAENETNDQRHTHTHARRRIRIRSVPARTRHKLQQTPRCRRRRRRRCRRFHTPPTPPTDPSRAPAERPTPKRYSV